MMDDDVPYILEVDGKTIVEIPWKRVYDDYPFYMFNCYPPFPSLQAFSARRPKKGAEDLER